MYTPGNPARVHHELCGVRSPVGQNLTLYFIIWMFIIQIITTNELYTL